MCVADITAARGYARPRVFLYTLHVQSFEGKRERERYIGISAFLEASGEKCLEQLARSQATGLYIPPCSCDPVNVSSSISPVLIWTTC
jgi:hypothetical protein